MARVKSAVGTPVHREGPRTLNLENFWGNGKTFTTEDLTADLDILSPGARLTELRENGFDVRVVDTNNEGVQGRSHKLFTKL